MKCPHCTVEIHPSFVFDLMNQGQSIGSENSKPTFWKTAHMACPACEKAVIFLDKLGGTLIPKSRYMVYPKAVTRPRAPKELPQALSEDFNEACLVLGDSPKASAALSRRCLQQLLKLQGFADDNLAKAIDAALLSKQIPGSLARNLDAVRNIGNFAAHPLKDTNSGAIIEVEPEESDWNLDVLEGLFDFYYVQPALDAAKIVALNTKLVAVGKPPMKI